MKKICKLCGKEFECYDRERRNRGGARVEAKRPWRAVTCSKKCSRRYKGK